MLLLSVNVNRRKIVKRLLEEDSLRSKTDYFKQYAILKSLEKKYPNENFWTVFKLDKKLTSLYYFKTPYGANILKKRYKEFLYKPSKTDKVFNLKQHTSEDIISRKTTRTVKDFLND